MPCITHAAVSDAQQFAIYHHADSEPSTAGQAKKTARSSSLAEQVLGKARRIRVGIDMDAKHQPVGEQRAAMGMPSSQGKFGLYSSAPSALTKPATAAEIPAPGVLLLPASGGMCPPPFEESRSALVRSRKGLPTPNFTLPVDEGQLGCTPAYVNGNDARLIVHTAASHRFKLSFFSCTTVLDCESFDLVHSSMAKPPCRRSSPRDVYEAVLSFHPVPIAERHPAHRRTGRPTGPLAGDR